MRILSETEYNQLIGTYSITSFMGGISGSDKSREIYLVKDKIYLCEANEDISQLIIEQNKEAEDYIAGI